MDKVQQLYEEYGNYTYYLALKLTKNKEEAEDVMQDVWVKVVRNQDQIDQVEKMKAWLTTICMNTFRDRYRKTVRRGKHVMNQPASLDVPILDLVPSDKPTPSEKIEKADLQTAIQRKIDELDDIYRETIEYFYMYQYSLAEISRVMDVSIGTVKSRLFRARKYLKDLLASDESMTDYVQA
mgnify:CR=1 FL=1